MSEPSFEFPLGKSGANSASVSSNSACIEPAGSSQALSSVSDTVGNGKTIKLITAVWKQPVVLSSTRAYIVVLPERYGRSVISDVLASASPKLG